MMKNTRIFLVSILIGFYVGCTPLPDVTVSDLSIPRKTRSGIKIIDQSIDLSQDRWWKKMHDPLLNRLISEALVANNQIQTAQANVMQAQAKLKQACFAWLPTLGVAAKGITAGTWDSHLTPQGVLAQSGVLTQSGILAQTGNINFRAYDAGFVPDYSLNILQNISNNQYAKASLEMQKAAYFATRLSIISQITGSYFMLLGQKEQLREQLQLIHDLKVLRRLEFARYNDGASDLSKVTDLDQQIAANQASISSTESSIAQVENAIQLLLNRNPGPIVTQGSIKRLSLQGLIPANISSAVLKNRPDIIMATANLSMSKASVGLAYANFFPTISLTGLLGGASVDLSRLLKLHTTLGYANVSAAMTVLNGSAYENIQAAKAGHKALYFSFIQTVRSAFADVDNSLTSQQKNNEAYANQLKAVEAAKSTYTMAFSRYKSGARDYRDVANALVSLDNAKLNLNTAKMQQLNGIVSVYQALAGGYKAVDLAKKSPVKTEK